MFQYVNSAYIPWSLGHETVNVVHPERAEFEYSVDTGDTITVRQMATTILRKCKSVRLTNRTRKTQQITSWA